MIKFFDNGNRKQILSVFAERVSNITANNPFETERNITIHTIITAMANNPTLWDKQCQFNIEWIGDQFINSISEENRKLEKYFLDDVCASCFRFLFEADLNMKEELSFEFKNVKQFVLNNIDSFEDEAKRKIEYAFRDMPISFLKELLNSEGIESLKTFKSVFQHSETLKIQWQKEIAERQSQVNKLKDTLEEYNNAFNFVGLYDGFNNLSIMKNKELRGIVIGLYMLSILAICPILAELIFIYFHISNIESFKFGLLVSIFPSLSLVLISIYYFRVFLFNYKSVKSQILQIELRKTLCQFIQSYTDYSKELKANDKDSLSKFENIIFSGIVTENDRLPSTFDGLEQVSKLIKTVKS